MHVRHKSGCAISSGCTLSYFTAGGIFFYYKCNKTATKNKAPLLSDRCKEGVLSLKYTVIWAGNKS